MSNQVDGKKVVDALAKRAIEASVNSVERSDTEFALAFGSALKIVGDNFLEQFDFVGEMIDAAQALRHCGHACQPPCPHTRKFERMEKILRGIRK